MAEQKQQVKQAVVNVVQEQGKQVLNNLLGNKKDTVKTDSTKTANPVKDVLQNKLQNLLKRKKN